MLLIPEVE